MTLVIYFSSSATSKFSFPQHLLDGLALKFIQTVVPFDFVYGHHEVTFDNI